MKGQELTKEQMQELKPGEPITLAAVMAVMIIAVIAVVAYKLMRSNGGEVKVPGGFAFSWK